VSDFQYRDWLQILGQFGVIASLLFVGLQLKQDHEIAQSVAYQERSHVASEFYWSIATDGVARSAMRKIQDGETELSTDEAEAALWFWRSGKEILQNSYYQYQNGYLDDEHWDQIRRLIRTYIVHPLVRSVLLDGNARESFQQMLSEIDAEVRAESAK
jgi:hypothetical protein